MKNPVLSIALCGAMLFNASAMAVDINSTQNKNSQWSDWYVGAKGIIEPYKSKNKMKFGFEVVDSSTCGNFDMETSFKSTFSKAKFKQLLVNLEEGIKAAVSPASLMQMAIKRANPDLFSEIQNFMAQAQFDFDNFTKSCEMAQNFLLDNSGGALDALNQKATFAKAKRYLNDTNLADAYTSNKANLGKMGIKVGTTHLGGSEPDAGTGQVQGPLNVTSELTRIGYNAALGRDEKVTTAATTDEQNSIPIAKMFKSPVEVNTFVTEIVGETFIKTESGIETESGKGIDGLIDAEYEILKGLINKVFPAMNVLYPSSAVINRKIDKVNEASAYSKLSRKLFDVLNDQNTGIRDGYVNSIAEDMSRANIVKKILEAKRIITTAMRHQDVSQSELLMKEARERLIILDAEIARMKEEENLKFITSGRTTEMLYLKELNKNSKSPSYGG
ncbi:MAG: hypothetical protein MJK11_19850 [Pseudomonadales bacterium]|uniref:hypothetical protein n=1 Tax=Moritella sp. TaxID=78556 RepID=UPI001D272406|nr:hypothetical protein [Moritella sp.]MCJ8315212.1 hypothetical protein [Pseudomonadales bacterium]NQZ49358.1 hypothetical protein [Moritella sp.]